jgi:hypothetical protein
MTANGLRRKQGIVWRRNANRRDDADLFDPPADFCFSNVAIISVPNFRGMRRCASGKMRFMAIPNVKRFRPFCPTCNDNFTLMAVLPKDANVDKYLADAVARHDHKAFQESKVLHFKVRVGQQKQKKAK